MYLCVYVCIYICMYVGIRAWSIAIEEGMAEDDDGDHTNIDPCEGEYLINTRQPNTNDGNTVDDPQHQPKRQRPNDPQHEEEDVHQPLGQQPPPRNKRQKRNDRQKKSRQLWTTSKLTGENL